MYSTDKLFWTTWGWINNGRFIQLSVMENQFLRFKYQMLFPEYGEEKNLYCFLYHQPRYCQSSIRLWIILWSTTDIIILFNCFVGIEWMTNSHCIFHFSAVFGFVAAIRLDMCFTVDINKYPHVQFIILLHTYDVKLPGNWVSKQNPSLHRGEAPSCWPARVWSSLTHTLLHYTAINVVSWSFLCTMSTWP